MRILCLWVVNYQSGSTSERFVRPLKSLGHTVDIIALEEGNIESKLIEATNFDKYDFLLHLPYPNTVRLEVIKHLPITTIAWCGDDEWFWNKYPDHARAIEKCHDYCVTTHKASLNKYRSGILGSWGYSNEWKPLKVEKDIDIYFCGSKTPIRDMYFEALIDQGFKVVMDGPGYSGKVPLKTMINRYQRAKIGLSFVTENKGELLYQQVKARSFEIPAVKTLQISEYCDGLRDVFKNNEIIYFRNKNELIKKCDHFLYNDKERDEIAARGHLRARKHSYKKTFSQIFKEIDSRETLTPKMEKSYET